jgi:putative zinc finger protein
MTDRHEHLDEGTIHAWLDGALAPDESARVESAAASCAECAALVAEARGLVAASSRILSSLDAVPAGVLPGTSANVDQLAALRARQRASTRHWWQDRRVMVAASLVFVAGVSSLVLRSTPDEVITPTTQMAAESTIPIPAPVAPPTAPSGEAANDAVAKSSVRERDMARSGAATAIPADTTREAKAISAPPPVVANETRRSEADAVRRTAADSIASAASPRDQTATIQRPLRQEGARQSLQQLRMDSTQQAPAPAALAPAGARLNRGMITGGVGATMADAAGPGGACYRLRGLTTPAVADTIRLLNEMAPVLSDPSWFRTQLYGAIRDTTLAWRSIDSVTVELRSRFGSDTSAVRFNLDGAAPEIRGVSGVRPVFATRVACPQ